jgi:GTPase Era involved in 16S rRNA processing
MPCGIDGLVDGSGWGMCRPVIQSPPEGERVAQEAATAVKAPGTADQARQVLTQVLDQTAQIVAPYDRPDLVERLNAAKARLGEANVRVLVVGEYKKGKSSLVNGILGVAVAPVDDDIATSVPTVVRFGEEARAAVTREPANGDAPGPAEDVPIKELASYVSEAGNPANERGIRMVEVWLPRKILQGGLVLVDTPGVGGLGSAHTAATLATLPTADAVIFVTDASQELTAPEVDFLRFAKRACPNLVSVLTKTDLYPEWNRILELDQQHLASSGLEGRLLPISSVLRQVALKTESKDINTESGYPDVVAYIRDEVIGRSEENAKRSVLNDAIRAIEQIEQPLAAERQALADPARTDELKAKLEVAKEDADRLRSQAARWQTTLSDGFGDLNAEVDHDLRYRMRETTRVAEDAIEQSDPGETWEEFRTWLNQRVTFEVVQNFSLIAERARELAELIAEHFEDDVDAAAPPFELEAPTATIEGLATPDLDTKSQKVVSLGFTAIRQAYSNVSMFSMFGNMAHIALGMTNPVTLVIGLLSGGKAIKDVKERELTGRRQQAKAAVRKYVDDVNFHVGKDFRDTIRHLQRELRTTFSSRAEEVQRSCAASLAAVQQAAQQDQADRQTRFQQVDAELKKLTTVKQRIAAVGKPAK